MLWPLALLLVVVAGGCTAFALQLEQPAAHLRAPDGPRTPSGDGEDSPLLRRRKEMAWEMV